MFQVSKNGIIHFSFYESEKWEPLPNKSTQSSCKIIEILNQFNAVSHFKNF